MSIAPHPHTVLRRKTTFAPQASFPCKDGLIHPTVDLSYALAREVARWSSCAEPGNYSNHQPNQPLDKLWIVKVLPNGDAAVATQYSNASFNMIYNHDLKRPEIVLGEPDYFTLRNSLLMATDNFMWEFLAGKFRNEVAPHLQLFDMKERIVK